MHTRAKLRFNRIRKKVKVPQRHIRDKVKRQEPNRGALLPKRINSKSVELNWIELIEYSCYGSDWNLNCLHLATMNYRWVRSRRVRMQISNSGGLIKQQQFIWLILIQLIGSVWLVLTVDGVLWLAVGGSGRNISIGHCGLKRSWWGEEEQRPTEELVRRRLQQLPATGSPASWPNLCRVPQPFNSHHVTENSSNSMAIEEKGSTTPSGVNWRHFRCCCCCCCWCCVPDSHCNN